MKKQSLKLFTAALVLGIFTVLASVSSVSAQDVLSFKIPFKFSVGNKTMSAGNYDLKKLSSSRYILRNAETKKSMLVISDFDTAEIGLESKESLVFNRYGETYFLRQVFVNRNQLGKEILESKQERSMRKGENETHLAKNQTKAEKISISSAQ